MKAPLLLVAIVLLSGCGDHTPPPSAANLPSLDQKPAVPPKPAPEAADAAAIEVTEPEQPAVDVCDLQGHDMSKMTAERHEELAKECERSKQ